MRFMGKVHYYKSAPLEAKPDLMALNPGPMTFRGGAEWPSGVYITTFDETERTAHALREAGIKPQVFLYHPGHLDLLEYLIARRALDPPYFVQLVFGQQSGINAGPESSSTCCEICRQAAFSRPAPSGCWRSRSTRWRYSSADTSAPEWRTPSCTKRISRQDNTQLFDRVVRIAEDVGRRVATPAEVRSMLGMTGARG